MSYRGQKRGRTAKARGHMRDYTPSGWAGPGQMHYRTSSPMKSAISRHLGVGKARKRKK